MLLSPLLLVSEPSGAPFAFRSPPPDVRPDSPESPPGSPPFESPVPESLEPDPDDRLDSSVVSAEGRPDEDFAPPGPAPSTSVVDVLLDEPQPAAANARQAATQKSPSGFPF